VNVLSLFDGGSCGQVAVEREEIKVDNYFASEIKKHAIQVTQNNYPNTIQLGNVEDCNKWNLPKIDLLMGGSPCQDLTYMKTDGLGLHGEKSKLFFKYVESLKLFKPTYFLLENVNMDIHSQNKISSLLEVEPIRINSNLVSFQNRNRLYWTNIPNVKTPKDRNISFQDFKEMNEETCRDYKVKRTPSRETMWGNGVNGKCPNVTDRDKINCLTVKQDRWSNAGLVEFEDFCRYLTVAECEAAQTLPIGYTNGLSRAKAYDILGDGWTVDVIAHILKNIKEG
jgi:site-specific DNA-cytosine methylase